MRLTRDEIRERLCDISEKYCDADDLKTLHTCVQTKVFLKVWHDHSSVSQRSGSRAVAPPLNK